MASISETRKTPRLGHKGHSSEQKTMWKAHAEHHRQDSPNPSTETMPQAPCLHVQLAGRTYKGQHGNDRLRILGTTLSRSESRRAHKEGGIIP